MAGPRQCNRIVALTGLTATEALELETMLSGQLLQQPPW